MLNGSSGVARLRAVGKVRSSRTRWPRHPTRGHLGIAHTRWATHGVPNERNAHPHISRDGVAIVHNGIIENHEELRAELERAGYEFTSDTDTEVIAHRIHHHLAGGERPVRGGAQDRRRAARRLCARGDVGQGPGLHRARARRLPAADRHSATSENFVASDIAALLPVTRTFIFLEEGDVACIRRDEHRDRGRGAAAKVERKPYESEQSAEAAEKGNYAHFMLKEIHEQPRAVAQTLQERVAGGRLLSQAFGPAAMEVLKRATSVHIVACGTSYHAGIVARYFIEQLCRVPCRVEIASEYRYRNPVVPANTLFVSISQSGETADTLAALRLAKQGGLPLDARDLQRAGELAGARVRARAADARGPGDRRRLDQGLHHAARGARHAGDRDRQAPRPAEEREKTLVHAAARAAGACWSRRSRSTAMVRALARKIEPKHHALFLGRGAMFPIAMEGALKLKEISYIHAEAYAAGELKHGPLALVDSDMPVIAVAPNNDLLEKLKSNLQEVRARGGMLYVFADPESGIEPLGGRRT